MSDDKMEVKFLGKILGTATGWDGSEEEYIFYDFVPADKVLIPQGTITLSIIEGKWEIYDDAGEISNSGDLLSVLNSI